LLITILQVEKWHFLPGQRSRLSHEPLSQALFLPEVIQGSPVETFRFPKKIIQNREIKHVFHNKCVFE
jgi:hypothetical protein